MSTHKMGRTSLVLVPIALLSRGAAFGVPLVVAMWFGVGIETDAWYWALAFPTFILVLASTALGTSVLPVLAEVHQNTPQRVSRFLGGLISWATICSASFGLLVCLVAPTALEHGSRFDEATRELAAQFLWELLPFMVLVCAGAVLRVACEVRERFVVVALSPMLRAVVVICTFGALLDRLGPHALPTGMIAGEFVQCLWWWFHLKRNGTKVELCFHLEPEVRRVAMDLAPILGGELLVALNLVVDKLFASWLPSGSVATLEFADRARVIPQTLLESTLVMVAFATWSNLRASGNLQKAREAMDQALRWTAVLAAPVLAGMFIGRYVLIGLMFERGEFTSNDTVHTADVLAWYLPGVLPNLLGILAVRAHIVERNLRLVFGLGVTSVVCNALLNVILIGMMGVQGIALATTLNMVLVPGLFLWRLAPDLPIKPRQWWTAAALISASFTVAFVVETQWGAPRSWNAPRLWLASIPCFGLLAMGWMVTRQKQQDQRAA